jgi:hypothetical protein
VRPVGHIRSVDLREQVKFGQRRGQHQ